MHFCALPGLESFEMKLLAWQFCDVALSKFVSLVIPANKTSSRGEIKIKHSILKLGNNLKKNGILIIYLKTWNNNNFNGLFQLVMI